MNISFTVPGLPQGKARPRFNAANKHTYTPQKTKDYEKLVRVSCLKQVGNVTLTGEVRAVINAFFPVPKSASTKDKSLMLEGKIKPVKKPDIDNIIKAVLDALNGAAYKDDSAVVKVTAEKFYSPYPRVEVVLSGNLKGRSD
jgi:Holliday junction resolvase RusA-like endonuclease